MPRLRLAIFTATITTIRVTRMRIITAATTMPAISPPLRPPLLSSSLPSSSPVAGVEVASNDDVAIIVVVVVVVVVIVVVAVFGPSYCTPSTPRDTASKSTSSPPRLT